MLRDKVVATALEKLSPTLRERAAKLTRDLPPEDARLDGIIAQRAEAFGKAKPNAARGAEVFQQNCAVCHRFKNQGGVIGPALDGIGARGLHRVIEDILDPNRNVDPIFRQTVIETKDGRTVAGANAREQGTAIVLTDPTGKELTVPKADIKSQAQSKLSLMPPVFETQIPPGDFLDLVSYLLDTASHP